MPDELTYRDAGVNIDEAQRALRSVIGTVQSTYSDSVVAGIGGFGALYRATFDGYERPLLVTSVDGVGTKTKVAAMVGQYEGLGRDIVNHCVNDILCQGAKPLFFMDYFGCSRLEGMMFEQILRGMSAACLEVGASLIGGETAEMPGVYVEDEVDVVGSIVGLVDADKKLPRGKVNAGDFVIGIASNGLHTNGYSLARRALFEMGGLSVRDEVPGLGKTIGEELIRPHKCYFNSVYPLLQDCTTTSHECFQRIAAWWWSVAPGPRFRSSSSSSTRGTFRTTRCTARSTWGSVWCFSSTGSTRQACCNG
jgi:phosphoribosylformylglycinamidine cyclo-ligase